MFDVFGSILLFVGGLGILLFWSIAKKTEKQFNKHGVEVIAKVKSTERLKSEGYRIPKGYNTTFEFEYKGEVKELTFATEKRFKTGAMKKAIYLPEKNMLSVGGEGFYVAPGADIVMYFFSFVFMFAGIVLTGLVPKSILWGIGILLGIIFLVFTIVLLVKSNGKNKPIYKTNEIDEFSSVDSELSRYNPDLEKKKKIGKNTKVGIIASILFLIAGVFTLVLLGKPVIKDINIKLTYPSVTGTVTKIYKGKDGLEHIICDLKVDGKEIGYDYVDNRMLSPTYKIGDKVKIYYDKDDNEKLYPSSNLGATVGFILLPLMFIYMSLVFIFKSLDKEQDKLYKEYILGKEAK